ncbi:hypothetical protein ACET3Z_001077 [Daucus carota]
MSTDPTQQRNDRVQVYPLSNNRVKITAGRPTSSVESEEEDQDQSQDEAYQTEGQTNKQNQSQDQEEDESEEEQFEEQANPDQNEENECEDGDQAQVFNAQPKKKFTKFKRNKEIALENGQRERKAGTLYPGFKYLKKDVQKQEGAKHINKEKDEVKIRISPRHLYEMIYFLTPEQKKWVRRTGFGLLLDFQLEMLPAKLAYNVLQIFDHNTVSLKLKDNDIEIQEQDVCDVLGLPYGGLRITFDSDEKYLERTISWHAQLNTHKDDEQITTQMIVQVMRNQEISLFYLWLFYVDRVRPKAIKLVERQFPSYIGWTEEILKERQAIEVFHGPFGVGSIVPPLREFIRETEAQESKDIVEILRRKAQDLLAAKFEFDDELKKSKEKFPDNEDIKSIEEMINENLNIRKDDCCERN